MPKIELQEGRNRQAEATSGAEALCGKPVELPIRAGAEIFDWWDPVLWKATEKLENHNAFAAWQGANGLVNKVSVYAIRWENPDPRAPVESVDFEVAGEKEAVALLLAITCAEQAEKGEDLTKAGLKGPCPCRHN